MAKTISQAVALKYSPQVLEEGVTRATKLINGIGADPAIRYSMELGGMTEADIAEGSRLLMVVLTIPPLVAAERDTDDARAQRAATAELDAWDEPNFARYGAALRRLFPSVAIYVFHDLGPSTGASAVTGVATFLSRVDALEDGSDPTRAATKKDDKKAVELLAKRGLDAKERSRLAALVKTALRPTGVLPAPSELGAQRVEGRNAALVALRDWYEDWAATARTVLKKRAQLIRVGLANRKVRKEEPAPTPNPT